MSSLHRLSFTDSLLAGACRALATLADAAPAGRPIPAVRAAAEVELTEPERRLSGALIRVNHVGEICAQALYEGQAASTTDPALRDGITQRVRGMVAGAATGSATTVSVAGLY